jgi:prevent-host-death family protein
MRPGNDPLNCLLARIILGTFSFLALSFPLAAEPQKSLPQCQKPIYLTFDTGHMGMAPLIAEVLRKHRVPVTFFGAHEKTQEGDGSLGQHWSAWWKERASEGHDIVVEKHGTPVAAVIGLARFEQLEDLEADLRSAALVLSRLATDNGVRIGLDEVIDSLGFNRAELEAELDADLRAGRI